MIAHLNIWRKIMTKQDELYNLKLHEVLEISDGDVEIRRVPCGWIYTNLFELGFKGDYDATSIHATSVFVPDLSATPLVRL